MTGNNGNDRRAGRVWYSTAEEIAAAIGRNRHDIPRLVRVEGLPAFKFCGKWTATDDDLRAWSRHIAKKYRTAGRK
jgi:hypothetical protein